MQVKYKYYVVINDVAHAIEMTEPYASEEDAQEFMKTMQKTESVWLGLENGDMVAINKLMSNVYFTARRAN